MGERRYQVTQKPFGFIRIVDLEQDHTDGYWDQNQATWMDVRDMTHRE